MIRRCKSADLPLIYDIINDAAKVYRGAIPPQCWKEPYMPWEELKAEIASGVKFWGYEEKGELIGVMGIQDVLDVSLIRHAYVFPKRQKRGIGGKLLTFLCGSTPLPVLVGTWAGAVWAIKFYEKYGFQLVSREEKDRLLRKYWSISEKQIAASVVLTLPTGLCKK